MSIKCVEKKSVVGYLCAGELQGFPFCFVFVVRCSSFRGKCMESLSLCLPPFCHAYICAIDRRLGRYTQLGRQTLTLLVQLKNSNVAKMITYILHIYSVFIVKL